MESHGEVKKGEFALKCDSPNMEEHTSNILLAIERTDTDYTSTGLFFFFLTIAFIFLCTHRNEKSLYLSKTSLHHFFGLPWWKFQLGGIILLHSIVRVMLVKPEKTQWLGSQAKCTRQEIISAMGQVHSSCSKEYLRYYWWTGFLFLEFLLVS